MPAEEQVPEEVQTSDFRLTESDPMEAVNLDEVNTQPQSDTGSSPSGVLQARILRTVKPEGSEQGESRWFTRQLVRRPWSRR